MNSVLQKARRGIVFTAAHLGGCVMVKLKCPKCLESLTFGDELRGSDVRCPSCNALLHLRSKLPSAAQAEAPARSAKPTPQAGPKPPPPDEGDGIEAAPVARKRRRRKKRRREGRSSGIPEWIVPLAIFVVAIAMNALIARRAGEEAAKGLMLFTLIELVLTVPATIAGMFVAAAALGINFGNIFTAALKVAAITVVVQCIYTFGMVRSED